MQSPQSPHDTGIQAEDNEQDCALWFVVRFLFVWFFLHAAFGALGYLAFDLMSWETGWGMLIGMLVGKLLAIGYGFWSVDI